MRSADFNGDGKLDVAVAVKTGVSILLGKGNGRFAPHVDYGAGSGPSGIVAADFNHDGKIDVAVTNMNDGTVSVLLGNSDGTFQAHKDYSTGVEPGLVVVGDFNGDGNLDLVVLSDEPSAVVMMPGKGDGTFPSSVKYYTVSTPLGIAVGDFNGDGTLDVATANYGNSDADTFSIQLGNGDGTLQDHKDYSNGGPGFAGAVAVADLDGDGSLDFAFTNRGQPSISVVLNKPVIALAPATLNFPTQTIGSTSQSQGVTISNPGSAPLTFQSIGVTGNEAADFSESGNCLQILSPGKNCTVNVAFTPLAKGTRQALLDIEDNTVNGQQKAGLTGAGTVVFLSSWSLSFGAQAVGTASVPQTVTLTNTGKTKLKIGKVSVSGEDKADFEIQNNYCNGTLAAGGKCQFNVVFQPTKSGSRNASVAIKDNGGGSPQEIALSGTGT